MSYKSIFYQNAPTLVEKALTNLFPVVLHNVMTNKSCTDEKRQEKLSVYGIYSSSPPK